jgi:TetR/AcrR family transcriptional regulator, transcriptional repressor for nem operon
MPKESTRLSLLGHGARLVHEQGFNNTGIQEILNAADVPKGSFYFYFRNKEDFGLQLIDFYMDYIRSLIESELLNSDLPPLPRLKQFFDDFQLSFERGQCKLGCPIGNLATELGDTNEAFREKLDDALNVLRDAVEVCLREAQELGELPVEMDIHKQAGFIINSWQGALIAMKAAKSIEPLEIFDSIIFERILVKSSG